MTFPERYGKAIQPPGFIDAYMHVHLFMYAGSYLQVHMHRSIDAGVTYLRLRLLPHKRRVCQSVSPTMVRDRKTLSMEFYPGISCRPLRVVSLHIAVTGKIRLGISKPMTYRDCTGNICMDKRPLFPSRIDKTSTGPDIFLANITQTERRRMSLHWII